MTNLILHSMNNTYSIIYASLRTLLKMTNINSILSIDELLFQCSLHRKFDVDFDLDAIEQRAIFDEKINRVLPSFHESIYCTDETLFIIESNLKKEKEEE